MKPGFIDMFARDSVHTFLTRCGTYFLAFLISVVISNLGQETKGQVAIVFFVTHLLKLIMAMGYDVAIIYFLRRRRYDYDTVARNLNSLGPILMLAWTASLLPVLHYLHGIGLFGDIDFIFICSCFVIAPLNGLMNIQVCILTGSGEITRANKLELANSIMYALFLTFVMLFLFADRWGVVASYAAAFAASGILGIAMNWSKSTGRRGFELNGEVIRSMGSWGLRCQTGIIARSIIGRVDLFLVNFWSSAFVAGVYSVALNWAELPQFIPMTLLYVLFPHASAREMASSVDLINRVSRLTALALVLTSVVICAMFPILERLIYRPDYSQAFYPLLVVMPGLILKGVFRVLLTGLDGLGKPEYSAIASVVALISAVSANVILIPHYGIIGAAAATSVTGAVAFFTIGYCYRKVSKSPWSHFLLVKRADIAHAFDSIKAQILRRDSK